MTLMEMSALYDDSALLISGRLAELRSALRVCGSEDESRRLRRRMAELKPMLTQCRKLSCLTAGYYDRDFYVYDEYRV